VKAFESISERWGILPTSWYSKKTRQAVPYLKSEHCLCDDAKKCDLRSCEADYLLRHTVRQMKHTERSYGNIRIYRLTWGDYQNDVFCRHLRYCGTYRTRRPKETPDHIQGRSLVREYRYCHHQHSAVAVVGPGGRCGDFGVDRKARVAVMPSAGGACGREQPQARKPSNKKEDGTRVPRRFKYSIFFLVHIMVNSKRRLKAIHRTVEGLNNGIRQRQG